MTSEEMALQLNVLESGCANCRTREARIVDALLVLGVESPVEKVTDRTAIASSGVVSTPLLAIDDRLVLAGRLPTVADLVDLISEGAR
jgi:hypothetical protein